MTKRSEIVFVRTLQGQATYDVLMSRLSAKECVRRWPELRREFVLKIRRENPKMRPAHRLKTKKA